MHWYDPPEPSLLQTKQSLLSQPFFTQGMLKLLHYPTGPLLDSSQYVHVLLILGSPELGKVLQMWPHQCWKDGKDHFCWPTDSLSPNADQNSISFLCSLRANCWLLFSLVSIEPRPQESRFPASQPPAWYGTCLVHFLKYQTLESQFLNYTRLLLSLSCHLLNGSKTHWFI